MSEHPEQPDAPDQPSRALSLHVLPAFTPVPRATKRHNGWKPEVQRAFIEALADTGSVKAACARFHRSDHGAYQLRRHPEAAEFRRAWDAALDIGVRRVEDGVMDRAINGTQIPVYSKGGELVGHRTVHNERLTTFILQNRAPDRFGGLRKADGARGENAVDKMELGRLKKRWHKEWADEREATSAARARESGDSFGDSVAMRHVLWWTGLSPRAQQAYRDFRRIEREDAAIARGGGLNDPEIDAALADYDETFAADDRAPIDKMLESEGYADARILGPDCPEPPPGRIITLNGTWGRYDLRDDDGRATPL